MSGFVRNGVSRRTLRVDDHRVRRSRHQRQTEVSAAIRVLRRRPDARGVRGRNAGGENRYILEASASSFGE